jgi:exopolysaccharide biosynthesis polyprenyl glycosylphosphotransferase
MESTLQRNSSASPEVLTPNRIGKRKAFPSASGIRSIEGQLASLNRLTSWLRTGKAAGFRSHPLAGSRLGWTAFDFIAGVVCVCLSASPVMNRGAKGSPHDAIELSVWGLMFGLFVSLFTRNSFTRRSVPGFHGAHEYRRLVKDVSISALFAGGLLALIGWGSTNRVMIETEICLTVGVMAVGRMYWKQRRLSHRRRGDSIRNFVVAGGAFAASCQVRDYLLSLTYAGYRFKGFALLDDNEPTCEFPDDQILGPLDGVIPLARSTFVDEIFLLDKPPDSILKAVLKEAEAAAIDIRLIPDNSEMLAARADLHYVGDLPTVVLLECDDRELAQLFKRLIDIVGATLALLLFMPLILFLALCVKLGSSGPAFYRSQRVGFKGRAFCCIKLRTMVRDAHALRGQLNHLNERDGILFKITNDPRITKIGAMLRKYSLDELPQFWNVLRGDMSLVGPRPPISSEVDQYSLEQFCRLEVPPGITGLWQVEARDDPSFSSYIECDRRYVNDWSLLLDMKILLRTLDVVFRGTGV